MIIVVIIIILIIILILTYFNISKQSLDIPQTSFSSLNDDHENMILTLDKFHDLCVDHWHEEERLYQLGKMKMPSTHKNIDSLWEEHNKKHKEFIDKIVTMRKDLIEHIEKYDIPHFHWG